MRSPQQTPNLAVRKLFAQGDLSDAEIGRRAGVSRQRVQQIRSALGVVRAHPARWFDAVPEADWKALCAGCLARRFGVHPYTVYRARLRHAKPPYARFRCADPKCARNKPWRARVLASADWRGCNVCAGRALGVSTAVAAALRAQLRREGFGLPPAARGHRPCCPSCRRGSDPIQVSP